MSYSIHQNFGRRGIAIIGPACHLFTFAVISVHPPFPVLVVMYVLVGLGSGMQNAAWNVWIGNMANSNEVLGFFHGFFGVGATVSPLVATSLISKADWPWYSFYHLMVSTFLPYLTQPPIIRENKRIILTSKIDRSRIHRADICCKCILD